MKPTKLSAHIEYHEIIVPIVDTVRTQYFLHQYIVGGGWHVLLCGETGTGKTSCIQQMMLKLCGENGADVVHTCMVLLRPSDFSLLLFLL